MVDDSEFYVRYDYAWNTAGWTAQDPRYTSGTDTYYAPGLTDVSLVRMTGKFLDHHTGRGLEGVLRIRTKEILTHVPSGAQVMPGLRTVRFRRDGFSILLPATDDPDLTPNGFRYYARLTVAGHTQEFDFLLPSTVVV